MKNLFATRELPDPVRRRVELAIAVAQERLLATHLQHALAVIHLFDERMPYSQAAGIYTRILGLTEDQAQVVTTRALAHLGEKVAAEEWAYTPLVPEPEEKPERRRNLLDLVRRRLQGRVDDEMRRKVEMAAARAEVALLDDHVANALDFIEILEREMTPSEAVEMYVDALEVRETIGEVVYYRALAVLADRLLPDAPREAQRETPPQPVVEEPRLRVVDRETGKTG